MRSRERTVKRTVAVVTSFQTATPPIASAAQYDMQDRSWTFSARVIQLKDASIYSIPGRLARIQYLRDGKTQRAWAVLAVDDYWFTKDSFIPTVGQEIQLKISGDFVSRYGVDLDKCSSDDEYCQYASFVEGGFQTSVDHNGMTLSPSNMLIYSGLMPDDWIHGMLAWRIRPSN